MEYYEKTPLDRQAVLIDTDYLDAVFIIASMILLMSSVRGPRLISQLENIPTPLYRQFLRRTRRIVLQPLSFLCCSYLHLHEQYTVKICQSVRPEHPITYRCAQALDTVL